jgi:hypothetical protein
MMPLMSVSFTLDAKTRLNSFGILLYYSYPPSNSSFRQEKGRSVAPALFIGFLSLAFVSSHHVIS